MAVDFSILARVPTIGSQIMAGQEAGREAAARNMLLQQRQLEFQQAQEDRSRKLEAERLQTEARPRLAQMLRQMGQNPGDLKAATEFTAAAFESNNPAAVTAGQEWIKLARELAAPEKPVVVGGRLVRPSTGEVVYQGPETAPRPIAIGNRLVSPTGEVVYEAPETPARPIAVGGRLVSPEGQVIYEAPETPARPIAIGNRLVSPTGEVVYEAPPPPSPTPRPIAVGGRLVSPEGQVIYEPPPAPAAAERPVVVGGRLVSPTGQVIYEPPPGTMTPSERFVPVGPNVFNRETGQFLPGPAREPAFRQTPEARVKPAAPIRVRPGEVVISPETGQPIFTAPPAPARAPAAQREGAKPAEKPATVTEQQASTATQRLLNRATEIADIVQRNRKAEAPTMTEAAMENLPYLSRATNLVRSTDRQIVSSAQDDILDALLYLSTGAAYNKEQLQQQKSAYLPSWSDDPPTRQVKRQRLAQAIEGARVRAGRAWTPELDAAMQRLMEVPVMGGRAPASTSAPAPAAPAPARAPAPAAARRREIAPGVFVTERP